MASHPLRRALAVAGVSLLAIDGPWATRLDSLPPAQAEPKPPLATAPSTIDVVPVDRDGRFLESLGPNDFVVTVNRARRAVVRVRLVSRGPGAREEAASRQAGAAPAPGAAVSFAAEPRRTVLVVVDQALLARGDERRVVQAAGLLMDRLGLDDRLAVLRIPSSSDVSLTLTTDRFEARDVLSRVIGQRTPTAVLPQVFVEPSDPVPVPDPTTAGTSAAPPPEQATLAVAPGGIAGLLDPASAGDTMAALRAVFRAMRQVPGRKVVAVFSIGVLPTAASRVNDTAHAAVEAHAVVYTFSVSGARIEGGDEPDTGPLERLAAATGGTAVTLGRNPGRAIEGVVGEMAGCYVLELDAARAGNEVRPGLRVEVARPRATVRAPAWLVSRPVAADEVPALPAPVAAAPPDAGEAPAPAARPAAASRSSRRDAEREAELQLALARLYAYADGYERQYSMLVAEEDYRQTARQGSVRLRSDLLLVRPERSQHWTSFRDVFEVNGRPVRDREERLQRLFLDPSAEAHAQLEAIRDESARYNIGPIERTVNVPLFPLIFLRPANRFRSDWELAGRDEAASVRVWRVRFVEQARPTLVRDIEGRDVPQTGWFLVDMVTGAIVESGMEARRGGTTASIVVKYRTDASLGLWVPSEMKETFEEPAGASGIDRWAQAGIAPNVLTEGRAIYSNYRRFQVKTEEKIAVPK